MSPEPNHWTIPLVAIILAVFAAPLAHGQNAGSRINAESAHSTDAARIPRTLTRTQWKAYGHRLSESMESDNAGVRSGALRLIALYGDRLQIDRQGLLNAVRLYRNEPNPDTRRLAVLAIARIDRPWGIDFLRRSLDHESEPEIARTIRGVLAQDALAAAE